MSEERWFEDLIRLAKEEKKEEGRARFALAGSHRGHSAAGGS